MSGPHKKGGHEEGGGHAPMWIVSFADMVILLMSFFVLLLCQGQQKSTTDDDLLKILASVKVGFGYRPTPGSKDPLDIAVLQVLSQRGKTNLVPSGQRWLSASIKGKQLKEKDNFVKAQSNIGKPIRFARDSDVLPKSAGVDLEQVAEVISNHYRMVVIQGHCSREEATRDTLEGHGLSFRRAVAVKMALEERGVAASRMRIVSCGPHEKLSDIKSPDRQLVVVTIGSYFLPSDMDVIDEGEMEPAFESKAPSTDKTSSHGGH